MGFLASAYLMLIQIQQQLMSGQAIGPALNFCLQADEDEFQINLRRWWIRWQQGDRDGLERIFPRGLQRAFVETLERGLMGEPILSRLNEIEVEMRSSMQHSIELHVQMLPLKMLVPVMCLIFPALALLLVGPMLIHLIEELSR